MGPSHTGRGQIAAVCSANEANVSLLSESARRVTLQFRAEVFKSPACKGFVGYGDADPSNVSSLVHGAEMRVAETRAVNRALRKAYGIGICSVEEIGSLPNRFRLPGSRRSFRPSRSMARTETTVAPKSAIASANSSASTNSMPTWSRPTPSSSAAPRPSGRLPVSRLKALYRIWPTGPKKTANELLCHSTAIPARTKNARHEALFRVYPSWRCVSHSLDPSDRTFLPSGLALGQVSQAQDIALFRNPFRYAVLAPKQMTARVMPALSSWDERVFRQSIRTALQSQ